MKETQTSCGGDAVISDPGQMQGRDPAKPAYGQSTNEYHEFIKFEASWVAVLFTPLRKFYQTIHARLGGSSPICAWLMKDHFLFFLVACAGLLVLSPRYIPLIYYAIQRLLLFREVTKIDTSSWPYTPNLIPAAALLFLLSFHLSARWRRAVLLAALVPLGLALDARSDYLTLAMFIGFMCSIYVIIKLPLQRPLSAVLVSLVSFAFMLFCNAWRATANTAIASITGFQPAFTPMLVYSTYEELPPKQRLVFTRYLVYHLTRFFGAPVIHYRDLFGTADKSLAEIRFDGIKALYIAMLAALTSWWCTRYRAGIHTSELTGTALLGSCYIGYVEFYCSVVVGFNIFIGICRLFGLPVRDNFRYWLLARTPNEHWQRWNLLLREWVLTYAFFPIMRAKRWLFAAVMAALTLSGLLHQLPRILMGRSTSVSISIGFFYWIVNGLAIYLVIKIPKIFPQAIERLKLRTSLLWSLAGIILTSAFYATLIGMRELASWAELMDYFSRLFLGHAQGIS